jgi:hypothetical protein
MFNRQNLGRPVIREKSQSRAQYDSPSLSPAHDGTSLYPELPSLAALSLWGGLFFAQHSRPSDSHREPRMASIIITALAAAKIPTNKK